jgi:glycerol 3-phosphatase-2
LTGNGAVPAHLGPPDGGGRAGNTRPGARTRPAGCPEPLSEHYDAALLDLDGVVYLGVGPIPGAAAALAEAARRGMKRAYVTNNASRTPHAIAAQLRGMGVKATAADIVTSAQAAAHLLADRLPAGSAVLVVGGTGLRLAVRDRGLRPVTAAADRPAAVVQGYSHDISYGLLAEAALAIEVGAFYVATNMDATLPTPRGPQPGNGSLVQVVVHATGTIPIVAGKPELPLHAESVERVGAVRPLVVGDRLDTDIEGAVRGETDSLLVLTGVTEPADLLLAPARRRPTYIAADLTGLNTAHPEVSVQEGGGFRCSGWTAAAGSARSAGSAGRAWLTVAGSGNWVDGLRALCAAAWTAGLPPGGPEEQQQAAADAVAAVDAVAPVRPD